jgi:hypothetical protein
MCIRPTSLLNDQVFLLLFAFSRAANVSGAAKRRKQKEVQQLTNKLPKID